MRSFKYLITCLLILVSLTSRSQEINCKVSINHSQIQGTNDQVFSTLENALKEFINDRKWTSAQYGIAERISCNFSITVKEYTDDGMFKCDLIVQSNRPVYNSNYSSVILNFKDVNFTFNYVEYDPLEFRDANLDNNLTAIIAYYVYLIIGMDMDTMSPLGGSEILHAAENIVNMAQTSSEPGWKAFDDSKNRHAIISDYLAESMKPLREMMYNYHRLGLDEMPQNADRGRARITESLELLKKAKDDTPMSSLPQIIIETKKEELLNIYSKGTPKEREGVYDILIEISPAQSNTWEQIKTAQ